MNALGAALRARLRGGTALWTVTLTEASGDKATVRAALAEFAHALPRRLAMAGALFALDRASETGRWHVHGLLLGPRRFRVDVALKLWRRLPSWPKSARPAVAGQHAERAERGDLNRLLWHHIGSRREGRLIPEIPPLVERVVASGALAGAWEEALAKAPRKPASTVSLVGSASMFPARLGATTPAARPKKAQAAAVTPRRERCGWCTKPFSVGKRRNAKWCCEGCGVSAARALRPLRATGAYQSVVRLVDDGADVRDAMRRVKEAAKRDDFMATALVPGASPSDPTTMACRCGAPLAIRSNARTCGRSACRMHLHRQRLRVRNGTSPGKARCQFVRTLRRRFPGNRFTHLQAFGVGKMIPLREATVRSVLGQLVEDGFAVCLLDGGMKLVI